VGSWLSHSSVREWNILVHLDPHQALLQAITVAKQGEELESEKPQVRLPAAATLSVCRGSEEHDANTRFAHPLRKAVISSD